MCAQRIGDGRYSEGVCSQSDKRNTGTGGAAILPNGRLSHKDQAFAKLRHIHLDDSRVSSPSTCVWTEGGRCGARGRYWGPTNLGDTGMLWEDCRDLIEGSTWRFKRCACTCTHDPSAFHAFQLHCI